MKSTSVRLQDSAVAFITNPHSDPTDLIKQSIYQVKSSYKYKNPATVCGASHCFPIEKVGRGNFTHMIARPSIKDIKSRKTCVHVLMFSIADILFKDSV